MARSPEPEAPAAPTDVAATDAPAGFQVHLASFDGPFDLLLSLISKRELDITEIALSAVSYTHLTLPTNREV